LRDLHNEAKVDALLDEISAGRHGPVNDPLHLLKEQAALHGIEVRYTQ
jgi:hypothetical protein